MSNTFQLPENISSLFKKSIIRIDDVHEKEFLIGFDPKININPLQYLKQLLGLDFDISLPFQIVLYRDLKTISLQIQIDEIIEFYSIISPSREGVNYKDYDFEIGSKEIQKLIEILYKERYPLIDVNADDIEYSITTDED